jgi:chemotaxis regulatin CheY-phosphate phosphatase CheZ
MLVDGAAHSKKLATTRRRLLAQFPASHSKFNRQLELLLLAQHSRIYEAS